MNTYEKIAFLTDIHGNAFALEAALEAIEVEGVDHVFCGGDSIAIGYQTNEVLSLLQSLKARLSIVSGNHDEAVLSIVKKQLYPASHAHAKEHHEWIARSLEENDIEFLTNIPRVVQAKIGHHTCLLTHYAYKAGYESKPIHLDPYKSIVEPSLENMKQLFGEKQEGIILFGHHHPEHHFQSKNQLFLNPGALGCQHNDQASYSIIENLKGQLTVKHKTIRYNRTEYLKGFETFQVPQSETILEIFYGVNDMSEISD